MYNIIIFIIISWLRYTTLVTSVDNVIKLFTAVSYDFS
jgi:hypothetical protein